MKFWRMLKWTVITFSIVCALTVALFLGPIAYLSRNTCDDTRLPLLFVIAGAGGGKTK
jgi:uncharacterized membrane protein YraQ (UPF0718 family)